MPEATLIIYQEVDGSVPLLGWLDRIPWKAKLKCLTRVERLSHAGHDLRRPDCDYLEGGIRELRARKGNVNYRILYAFIPQTQNAVLLSHGCTKKKSVPTREI